MKQTCTVFLAVLALLIFASTAWAQNPTFIRGDVNADGVVDGTDVTQLQNHIFGMTPVACTLAADANDDGMRMMTDVTYLTSFVNSGGPPPPAPYPDCGEDPTDPQPGTSCCELPEEAAPVPSISTYGAGILALLLIATALWVWRKKHQSAHA